jgi:hypothetical protein
MSKMASFPLRRNSDFEESTPEAAPRLQAGQMLNVPLGTLIYRAGLLTQEEVQEALADSIRTQKMLGEVLLERGMVEERELGRLLAGQKGLPFVELDRIQIDHDVARRLSEDQAREQAALPLAVDPNGTPLVAVVNPDATVVDAITTALGVEPHVGVAARGELLRAIDAVYAVDEPEQGVEDVPEQDVEQPSLRLADAVDDSVTAPVVERVDTWRDDPGSDVEVDVADDDGERDDFMPTASTAEAEESFEDEAGADDDEPSESEQPGEESHTFSWRRADEELVASADEGSVDEVVTETTFAPVFDLQASVPEVDGDADEPTVALDQPSDEEVFVDEEEPVLALVAAAEHEVESEASGETVLTVSVPDADHEAGDESDAGESFGDETFESFESFDDEPVVALTAPEPELEVITSDQPEATDVGDLVVEAEPELEELPSVENTVVEDEETPVVAEAAESEVAAEVFITLSNGERLSTGRFSESEASSRALSLVADVKRNWWPHVDGRLIRPDAILSIDIETTVAD